MNTKNMKYWITDAIGVNTDCKGYPAVSLRGSKYAYLFFSEEDIIKNYLSPLRKFRYFNPLIKKHPILKNSVSISRKFVQFMQEITEEEFSVELIKLRLKNSK